MSETILSAGMNPPAESQPDTQPETPQGSVEPDSPDSYSTHGETIADFAKIAEKGTPEQAADAVDRMARDPTFAKRIRAFGNSVITVNDRDDGRKALADIKLRLHEKAQQVAPPPARLHQRPGRSSGNSGPLPRGSQAGTRPDVRQSRGAGDSPRQGPPPP